MLSMLTAAAGGVARERCRPWQRRAYLRDLLAAAAAFEGSDDRVIRELARSLRSMAEWALRRHRRGWLHVAVAGLAEDLLGELVERPQQQAVACGLVTQLPATGRCTVCKAVVAVNRQMCFAHWSQVPRWLQRKVVLSVVDGAAEPELLQAAIAAVRHGSGKRPAWRASEGRGKTRQSNRLTGGSKPARRYQPPFGTFGLGRPGFWSILRPPTPVVGSYAHTVTEPTVRHSPGLMAKVSGWGSAGWWGLF